MVNSFGDIPSFDGTEGDREATDFGSDLLEFFDFEDAFVICECDSVDPTDCIVGIA